METNFLPKVYIEDKKKKEKDTKNGASTFHFSIFSPTISLSISLSNKQLSDVAQIARLSYWSTP
jgi:hypothetical protein